MEQDKSGENAAGVSWGHLAQGVWEPLKGFTVLLMTQFPKGSSGPREQGALGWEHPVGRLAELPGGWRPQAGRDLQLRELRVESRRI